MLYMVVEERECKGALKVLVIDDQTGVRMLMEEILEDEDCCVCQAPSGTLGIEILESFQPHIVFVDYKMPVIDGMEIAERIRKKDYNCTIILMTAYQDIDRACADKIVDQYLLKPFDIQNVKDILRSAFDPGRDEII